MSIFGALAALDDYDPNATFPPREGTDAAAAAEVAAARLGRSVRRPSETSQETIDKLAGAASDVLIPKTPLDWGLTAATLPAGPLARPAARVAAGAIGALFEPGEAQAEGPVGKAVKAAKNVIGSLFDYSKIHDVPDVKQFDLKRYDPKHGASERVQELIANKRVERAMLEKIEQGKGIGAGAETFYYNEPLREAFVSELGKKEGPVAFARYMDYVAATSPRSDIEANARNASYYYGLERRGEDLPKKNPYPYGHMAQQLHRTNAGKIRSGEYFDTVTNPKPLSFSQNLQGNFAPVTVDAHALKLPAMLAKDPEFIAGSIKLDKKSPTINPTKMLESGELTMDEALKRPVYWSSKPNRNEYAAMEQYYKRLAAESGMAPAQAQAAAWAAGGPMTGLKSVAGDPFMRAVENRANITAAKRGISPAEALSRMMRGKEPLLAVPPAAVMGGLAAQDDYRM
jgi:hypothetical protein